MTISDATSGKELLKISPVKYPAPDMLYKCKIEGKAASLTYEAGKLKNGRTLLYTAKQSVQKMDGSMAKLVTFERRAGSGKLPPAEVSCATFKDNGRTEYVVYNQRFASANEAAQGISRSTIVARATIGQHVVDDPSKIIPVNGKLSVDRRRRASLPTQGHRGRDGALPAARRHRGARGGGQRRRASRGFPLLCSPATPRYHQG